jgi:phosphatidylserine decarboxylase
MEKQKKSSHTAKDLTLWETITDTVLFPIHQEGWKFIAIFAAVTIAAGFFNVWLSYSLSLLTAWCVFFFRNPRRVTPARDGLIVSPAFGKICDISYEVEPPAELTELDQEARYTRVSIFLSVFDVHVNRIPVDGKIVQKTYRPGKFVNAATDKASRDNEMAGLVIQTKGSEKRPAVRIGVCQIAGWVARRIVTTAVEGANVRAGEELGIIRFGSRADIYLPEGITPKVCKGQRTVEGETVIADMFSKEPPRQGAHRGGQ